VKLTFCKVAVGDSPTVTIFNITEDLQYEKFASVSMSASCFSSDWDSASSLFAVVQQSPGLVTVWEYPSLNVIARLPTRVRKEGRGRAKEIKLMLKIRQTASVEQSSFTRQKAQTAICLFFQNTELRCTWWT
jgi:hypothetical protein